MDASSALRVALELFQAKHYPGVVAVCGEAVNDHPRSAELRMLLGGALMALGRLGEAQDELVECLRHAPQCAQAHRLLAELAVRRRDLAAARELLRECLRLDPEDGDARTLLDTLDGLYQPTAAVDKLPAATAAVGCTLPEAQEPLRPRALGTENDLTGQLGFAHYLLDIGALSASQHEAVIDLHRRTGVRVGRAAVELGYLSIPRVEWAAVAYHRAK